MAKCLDEIQDSSNRDLILISLLAGPDPDKWNLCVVGDSDQSIYSFRGANVSEVLLFVKKYDLVQLNMGQNYRSTKTIVEAANSVVINNKVRVEKEVFTENEEGSTIKMITVADEKSEAKKIVNIVRTVTSQGTVNYGDIAVLYRYRGQSRLIETEMMKQNIPCKVVSGGSFFSRRIVKDLLAYVRLVVNPCDREAFNRIVNVPHRHVGEASLKAVLTYIEEHDNVSVFDACRNVSFRQRETKRGIDNFVAVMQALCEIAHYIDENADNEDDINVAMLIRETCNLIDYRTYIKEYISDDVEDYESDLNELLNIASEYKSVNDFVTAVVENDIKQDDNDDVPRVKLMTLHGSKGLEWPVVIIAGNNEGTIPSYRSLNEGNLEEERRLFFVGMTRAKKLLFLTRAKEIMYRGKHIVSSESRFIKEIKPEYLKRF